MRTKETFRSVKHSNLLMPVITIIIVLASVYGCASSKKKAESRNANPQTTSQTAANTPAIKRDANGEEIPFVEVEEMPIFPGGDSMLLEFIAHNTVYPETAKLNKIQGRVILRFCVTEKGTVNKISVLKGVDPLLDAEAVRVAGILPQFKPGRQGGRDVPVWYMIPITFALK